MRKLIKLGILIIISLSVYFIYQKTKNSTYQITSIGDHFSEGITSYGIKDLSYIDDVKMFLEEKKEKVEVNKDYTEKDQTIKNSIQLIENTPKMKRTLTDTNLLIITLGYNDLLYALAIEEDINEGKLNKILKDMNTNYQTLIEEIRKYYHEEIIVVGYPSSNTTNLYQEKGIRELNKILRNNPNIIFIDSKSLLKNRDKYFENPLSSYPNREGYLVISKEIIKKTLEIP